MIEHSGVGYEGFFSSFFFLFPLDIPGARFFCLPLRDKEFSKTLPSNSLVPRPLTLSPFSHIPTLETPQLIYLVEKVNQVEPQGFNVQVSAREKKKKKEREEAAAATAPREAVAATTIRSSAACEEEEGRTEREEREQRGGEEEEEEEAEESKRARPPFFSLFLCLFFLLFSI